jgi:hypothetical protein
MIRAGGFMKLQTLTRRRRSNSAVKQIVLAMNKPQTLGLAVKDLDDFHLPIKPAHRHRIRRELETETRHACGVRQLKSAANCRRNYRRDYVQL